MMNLFLLALWLSVALATPTQHGALPLNKKQVASCPLHLPAGNFEFPHLIVPISSVAPNGVFGNSFTPSVSPNDFATIFNFDIPASRAGQNCSLYFSLPTMSQLVTTSFSYWGPGTFQYAQYQYDGGATAATTWNTQPSFSSVPPTTLTQVTPGHSYKIWSGSCGQGGLLSWRMSTPDSCLWYFQDYNDCAIGTYIIYG